MLLKGWRDLGRKEFQPYHQRREEMSIQDGCVLVGSRVIIPSVGRSNVMDELHEGHPGISRIKGLAERAVQTFKTAMKKVIWRHGYPGSCFSTALPLILPLGFLLLNC